MRKQRPEKSRQLSEVTTLSVRATILQGLSEGEPVSSALQQGWSTGERTGHDAGWFPGVSEELNQGKLMCK